MTEVPDEAWHCVGRVIEDGRRGGGQRLAGQTNGYISSITSKNKAFETGINTFRSGSEDK